MKIYFLGASGTVTGSKYLLDYNNKKILVDCGLFQGLKSLRLKNWEPFLVNPSEINAVILTHAHIDHSGFIPRLIKEGFRGKIYSTAATKELCNILLPDSGYLMEEEAEFLNRHKKTKHSPALPLFTQKEAEDSLSYFEVVDFKKKIVLDKDFSFEFLYAGHILGAASVVIDILGTKIGFTGDIGRMNDKIFFPPAPLPLLDYLITESTYGNRLHKKVDVLDELSDSINETCQKNGVVLIPAFAVGRAQALIYNLSLLKQQQRIPDVPIYLNSPMATNVSRIFCNYNQLHRLSEKDCSIAFDNIRYIHSVEESKKLNTKKGPMVIISASGMLTGGRILHHIKEFAPYPQNSILLTGYQAAGTRGEALERGTSEIKIHGEYVPIKAKVKILHNMSAHADFREAIQWFTESKISPKKVFITHGEASASDEFRRRLIETFGWSCVVPSQGDIIEL